ncbi:MAG TPA: twin-arginine translocation signal domain-containing protein, partial [Polyangiaceae bacterium]|nr:twin-arginine translocation signal domain-containing protein [Polyangiaceae bacterium]
MVIDALKNLEGPSRRRFLKWAGVVGALLAVERSRFLEVIGDSAGVAMADASTCAATNKSFHVVAGNGGFAWFQLLWPHVDIAKSGNDAFAYHAFGQGTDSSTLAGTDQPDKPFYWGPEAPFMSYGRTKYMSAFMAGNNQTHTATPGSAATVGNNQSMLAVCAAIQRTTPSLLPVIGINPLNFGQAPGAPGVITVDSADGLVQLFNSAASRAILSVPQDAALYDAYYKALLGLNKASARPTQLRGLRVGKQAAGFLGQNLAAKLQPTQADLDRYGITGGTPNKISEIAKACIVAAKAFGLNLTQSVITPAMRDDPHGAFGDMQNLNMTVKSLGKVFDEFMNDLASIPDPSCNERPLSDSVIMTVHGDTPKDPRDKSGWPDGTPNDSNWLYVMGNGYTKSGWFGGVRANGNTDGFDSTNGNTVPNQAAANTSAQAGAAVAYAVAKGDMRRVQDFYSGPS